MKKNFLRGENSTLLAAMVFGAILLFTSLLFSSCRKEDDDFNRFQSKAVAPQQVIVHDTIVTTDTVGGVNIIFKSFLQERPDGTLWGVVDGTNGEEHKVWQYPLGHVGFSITPNDTTLDAPTTNHSGFNSTVDSTVSIEMDIYRIVSNIIHFTDNYLSATFTKTGTVDWKNGSVMTEWGYEIPFPRRDVTMEWLSVAPSEVGSDANFDYTLFTTTYNLKYLGAIVPKNGFHTTKREKGSDVLVDSVLQNQGWQPLTYTSFGWPATALSWIEIVYNYSQSGPTQPVRKEATLTYGCTAPADTTVIAPSFNLNWANPQLGSVVTIGTSTTNGITITSKKQNYAVGASGLFTRRFVYTWQTAKYGVFDMPSPAFTGHSESHTLTDLSPVTGYDRKLATNTASASLNGISGQAPAKTIVKVEADPGTPDDPVDSLVSRTVINSGLTYVNPTTNTSWIKIREVWTVSGTHEYTVQVNLTNGMTCPAEGPVIVDDFGMVTPPGAGTTGNEELVNTYTNGDFQIKKYRKTYTGNLAGTPLVWIGTYEKPVYVPMNYTMPSSAYTYAVSAGGYSADLGQTLTQNTTYNRKLWTQNITATLNQHTQSHSGTLEVWSPDYIERQTPPWLGELLDGRYSRIQQGVGETFKDCVAFKYENGVVLFINGNTSNPLIFAKNATLAAQHNVPVMGNYAAWYSAEYHDGGWWPAKITPVGDYTSWTYVADANNTHSVTRANALVLGIGYDYHPVPTHQTFVKNGNVGTISYSANNTSSSMTASITYW